MYHNIINDKINICKNVYSHHLIISLFAINANL